MSKTAIHLWRLLFVFVVVAANAISASASPTNDGPIVTVHYRDKIDTAIDLLDNGAKYFPDRNYTLKNVPSELIGLSFTLRAGGHPTAVDIAAPAGAVVYLLVDGEKGDAKKTAVDKRMKADGWSRLPTAASYTAFDGERSVAIYRMTFSANASLLVRSTTWSSYVVASKNLAVGAVDDSPSAGQPSDNGGGAQLAQKQVSMEALEISQSDSGMMLGMSTEVTLTLTPSNTPRPIELNFVTSAGHDMNLSKDDAVRYITLSYPQWYANRGEVSFEDKYVPHDGGSLGAGLGTMVLSAIQGFSIDPEAAIAGDISANGKVRAIGGIAAKLRGAVAGNCSLVAVPMDNEDQLIDAVIHDGPDTVSNVQVFGIRNLDDAVAVMRKDRDPRLTQAIGLFNQFHASLQQSPGYLYTKDAQDVLNQVLLLAPDHLSAQILLRLAEHKLRPTMTATATRYYTFVAVQDIFGAIRNRWSDESPAWPHRWRCATAWRLCANSSPSPIPPCEH